LKKGNTNTTMHDFKGRRNRTIDGPETNWESIL